MLPGQAHVALASASRSHDHPPSAVLEDFHELIDDSVFVAALMGRDHVAAQMASENQIADLVERAVHRFDLLEHFHAVHLLVLEHAQYAFDMTPNGQQAAAGIFANRGIEPQTVTAFAHDYAPFHPAWGGRSEEHT